MEAWFLNQVLCVSVSVLLLGLQGLLGAGTPSNQWTESVAAGITYSTVSDERNDTKNSSTSTLYPESLSPSQGDILLSLPTETHTAAAAAAAGSFGSEHTQPFTETSSRSLAAIGLSTETLTSTPFVAITEAISRNWKDFASTEQALEPASAAVSLEASSWMQTEQDRLPQDSPVTTLRQEDTSQLVSHTAIHTSSTLTSTTMSRAGERTLLSVTSSSSNSTSSVFTEDTNSHQPPSTWGMSAMATETEHFTPSAPSSRTDLIDTTDQNMANASKVMFSETESTGGARGTQNFDVKSNATQHQDLLTSEETSDSTPPLRMTEASTDQVEVSVSSAPPVTSPAEGSTYISGTDQGFTVGTSTESSTGVPISSTQTQHGTEMVSSQTSEQGMGFGLTTGPPTVSISTSEQDGSFTDSSGITEAFLSATPVTVTERLYLMEENTSNATLSTTVPTTTMLTLPATSIPESVTEATHHYTTSSTTSSTLPLKTSAAASTSSIQTQGPSSWMFNPTSVTTLQIQTSTHTPEVTTIKRHQVTTAYTYSTTTKGTEPLQTTSKQTDRGTTEMLLTTLPTGIRSTTAPPPPPPPPPPPRNPCVSNPCTNGGMCVSDKGHQFTCHCQEAWTGPTCQQDVDECERDPCPVGSRCVNTRGSFSCECPLGFDLEDGRTCTRAKTFLGMFSVNRLPQDPVIFKNSIVHEIQREIIQLLNASLSGLQGYSRSILTKKEGDGVRISAVNMFSISTNVTSSDVYTSIQMSLSNCSSSLAHCRMVMHHQLTYHMESLCVAQKTQCDTERSTCTDRSGTALCQCHQGYYKHDPDDLSCLECRDGYKLENGTCVPCMFGFGGFNCGNFYKLIAVVVAPAGGALLLILVIVLIVTCCKKDKNDINKLIFKSGDLQMSPYADFPKCNRISMEWGRETIEMQENGSTKNLLQMTDIYYSPALRNSDLERNGLYPFTGLPGSRHSCIYPAQWNPSFISDDSRRRDYF